jgi:hypothetical protein
VYNVNKETLGGAGIKDEQFFSGMDSLCSQITLKS